MAAIELIVFAVAAGFAFVVVTFVIVVIAVRQEERHLTLMDKTAPSAMAKLARLVLGRYVRKEYDSRQLSRYPDELASSRGPNSREHTVSPRS